MRCRISFALLRFALLCLCGTRCIWDKNVKMIGIDLYLSMPQSQIIDVFTMLFTFFNILFLFYDEKLIYFYFLLSFCKFP